MDVPKGDARTPPDWSSWSKSQGPHDRRISWTSVFEAASRKAEDLAFWLHHLRIAAETDDGQTAERALREIDSVIELPRRIVETRHQEITDRVAGKVGEANIGGEADAHWHGLVVRLAYRLYDAFRQAACDVAGFERLLPRDGAAMLERYTVIRFDRIGFEFADSEKSWAFVKGVILSRPALNIDRLIAGIQRERALILASDDSPGTPKKTNSAGDVGGQKVDTIVDIDKKPKKKTRGLTPTAARCAAWIKPRMQSGAYGSLKPAVCDWCNENNGGKFEGVYKSILANPESYGADRKVDK